MSDQHDFELFSGPAPSEKSEMSDEQFHEEIKRTQQALAQLQREEGQAKTNDFSLASIIVSFLSQPGNTDLFLLISRAVAQNIPSELIIAVLSLIDKRSHDEVKGMLESGKKAMSERETALAIHKKADFHSISPTQKRAIDKWVENISEVSFKKPHQTLETIIIPGQERQLSIVIVQLSAFILRNYLKKHDIEIEYQNLRDFMQEVFVEIVKNLEKLIQQQRRLR